MLKTITIMVLAFLLFFSMLANIGAYNAYKKDQENFAKLNEENQALEEAYQKGKWLYAMERMEKEALLELLRADEEKKHRTF